MTRAEFNREWAVLVAALGFETGEVQDQLYFRALQDLDVATFHAGIKSLVLSPDFAEYSRFRRLPTLAELREECEAKADRRVPLMRCGAEMIPLAEYSQRVAAGQTPGGGEAPKALPAPGPGNASHALMLRQAEVAEVQRARAVFAGVDTLAAAKSMPELEERPAVVVVATDERLAALKRQAALLREMDELLGPGEPVAEPAGKAIA
jgi:hypothetical protein